MSTPLIAFHGDTTLKEKIVVESRRHREQDRLIHGTYQRSASETFKGCAVGCSIHSLNVVTGSTYEPSDHSCYEPGFGVPEVLARLQDGIFEGLEQSSSMEWPTQFWEAIPIGADLSMVWPQFALWLLSDANHGVARLAKSEQSKAAIESVAALYRRWIGGDKPGEKEWRSAAADASLAADATYAADAAADAAAAYAAYAADADADADDDDAKITARKFQSEKLLELLRSAPIR